LAWKAAARTIPTTQEFIVAGTDFNGTPLQGYRIAVLCYLKGVGIRDYHPGCGVGRDLNLDDQLIAADFPAALDRAMHRLIDGLRLGQSAARPGLDDDMFKSRLGLVDIDAGHALEEPAPTAP